MSGDNIVNIILIFITNLLYIFQSIVKFMFKPVASSLFVDCSFNFEIDLLSKKVLSLLGSYLVSADLKEIPKDCELTEMASYLKELSVFTLKGGQSIILRKET